MRHLFTIDTHDYDPNGTKEVRPSVRGIILREGKVLLVHSLKYDYYKFPGGGIEPGEEMEAALGREWAKSPAGVARNEGWTRWSRPPQARTGPRSPNYNHLGDTHKELRGRL